MSNTDSSVPPQKHAFPQDLSAAPATPILRLHHYAYRCRDAEETRHFYEDLLGLPLYHVIQSDTVPSTGEYCPYTHIFFRLHDGSFIAFFDLGDDQVASPSANTPAWVNHLALQVGSLNELKQIKQRLELAKVKVIGITDHRIFKSIYFFDPNGVRLELTAQLASPEEMHAESLDVHEKIAQWTEQKKARLAARGTPQATEKRPLKRPEYKQNKTTA